MFKIIVYLSIYLHLLNMCQSVVNRCSLRGKCGEFNAFTGDTYPIPCLYSGDPKPFTNKSLSDELRKFTLEPFKAETPVFCCNEKQASDIMEHLSLARDMLKKCPSCFVNFAKIFFHMSCAQNQAEFIDVTYSMPSSTIIKTDGDYMVTKLTYYVSEKFANDTFNSCKDVQFPSAATRVMTAMCGEHGLDCTPRLFLTYLGTKDPSPIQSTSLYLRKLLK